MWAHVRELNLVSLCAQIWAPEVCFVRVSWFGALWRLEPSLKLDCRFWRCFYRWVYSIVHPFFFKLDFFRVYASGCKLVST